MRLNGKEIKFGGNYKWNSQSLKKRFYALDIGCLLVLPIWAIWVTKNMDQLAISAAIGVLIIVVFQVLMNKIKKADKAMKHKDY